LIGCNSTNGKKHTYNDFVPGRDEYWKTLKEDQEKKDLAIKKKEESLQTDLETLKLEKERLIEQNNKANIKKKKKEESLLAELETVKLEKERLIEQNSKENIKIKNEEDTRKINVLSYSFSNRELTFNENLGNPNNKIQQFERNEKYYQIISNQESNVAPKLLVEKIKSLKNSKYKDLGIPKKEFETTKDYNLYQSYLEYNFRKEEIFHNNFSVELKKINYNYNADNQNLMVHLPDSIIYDKTSKVIMNNPSYYEDTGYKIGEQKITKKNNEKKLYENTNYKVKFSDKETILSLKIHPSTYKKYFYEKKERITAKYVYSIDFSKDVLVQKDYINPLIKEYYLPTTIKYIEIYYDGSLIDSLCLN